MGLNPGPTQAESIQQAYISKNLHFNNQNDKQEITGAVNGVKRASFEMAQSAGTTYTLFFFTILYMMYNYINLSRILLFTLSYLLREQDVISEQGGKFSQNS